MRRGQREIFKDTAFLVVLSAVFLLCGLRGSLASWDEAIYAGVAKGILQTGDWLNLPWQGSPFFDKPPLGMWLMAVSYKVFGISEFSSRLVSALFGIGTVLVTYFLGRKGYGRLIGFLGALVLLSSSHFIHYAKWATLDSAFLFFFSLVLYWFWLGRTQPVYLILSGIAFGLGFMTKGMGMLLPEMVIGAYVLVSKEWHILKRPAYWLGLLAGAVILVPWHLYQLIIHKADFLTGYFGFHLIRRTLTAMDGHTGSYLYYLRTVVNKYHPWVVLALFSVPVVIYQAIRNRSREATFTVVWIVFVFVFFTLVQTKLDWYILPIYPALSITIALVLEKILQDSSYNFIRFMFSAVMVLHVPFSHIWDLEYSPGIKALSPVVQKITSLNTHVALYNYHEGPAIYFYSGRIGVHIDDVESLRQMAKNSNEKFVCIIQRADFRGISRSLKSLNLQVAGGSHDLLLLSRKS